MGNLAKNGYGQVEPNQLSAQKTGQIYASLPLDAKVKVLQNGQFMFYDYQSGKVSATDSTGVSEPMLVFNEIKLYEDQYRTSYKDFAMIRVGDNYVTSKLATDEYGDGATTTGVAANPAHTEYPYRMDGIAPRLFKTNIGDIYTTNMVVDTETDYAVGQVLVPTKVTYGTGADAYDVLELTNDTGATAAGNIKFVVVKVYTMPDGQPAVKLQRVA
jgi:hypothetical protein